MSYGNEEDWSEWGDEWASTNRPKLFVSVSGGRTSMFMARIAQETYSHNHDIQYVFANTGMESNETLDFIHQCDQRWGLGVVWLEAKFYSGKRKTGFNIVSYQTAKRWGDWRNGSPYESMIEKYGIPNTSYPHCTRELKLAPMYSYINSLWGKGKGNYSVMVGIRADEQERCAKGAYWQGIIYPLVNMGYTKADVNAFWREQDFDLGIPDYKGNCINCWKKSFGKLATVNAEMPDAFNFTRHMEEKYRFAGFGRDIKAYFDADMTFRPRRWFFRGNRSTDQMLEEGAKYDLASIRGQQAIYPDENSGCTESCEAFGCAEEAVW